MILNNREVSNTVTLTKMKQIFAAISLHPTPSWRTGFHPPPYQCLQSAVPRQPHVPSNHPPPEPTLRWLKKSGALSRMFIFFWENTNRIKEIISEVLESLRMEKKQNKTSLRRSQPPKHFKMHLTSRCAATASNFSWEKTYIMVPGHPT